MRWILWQALPVQIALLNSGAGAEEQMLSRFINGWYGSIPKWNSRPLGSEAAVQYGGIKSF